MAGDFDEGKHPRAKDGKFGSGSGTGGGGKHPMARDSHTDDDVEESVKNAKDGARASALRGDPGHQSPTEAGAIFNRPAVAPASPEVAEHHAEAAGARAREQHASEAAEHAVTEATLHAAHTAGHIDDSKVAEPVQAFLAAKSEREASLKAAVEPLDSAQRDAADAFAAFKAADSTLGGLPEGGLDGEFEEFDGDGVIDGMSATAQAIDEDHDGYEGVADKHSALEHDEPPESSLGERSDYESDDDYEASKKEHAEWAPKLAKLRAEHKARAEVAQTALEALHEHQQAARDTLKSADKSVDKLRTSAQKQLDKMEEHDFVNEAAFADHEKDEDTDEFSDPKVQAQHERAKDASATLHSRYNEALSDESGGGFDEDEAEDAVKESQKTVAAAIKRLSKITGRAPSLPEKPKKPKATKTKKSNRPAGAIAATVAPMARHRLRLSKLEFISLVDRPAQAPATCRLIKRAGAQDALQVRAEAKLVKVADTATGPLAYFWAFTCTDENGAPYHDLQGDAVAPDAFIKAAEDFMASGGAVDDMHDGKQSSRIAFAFPMDSEIASAMFGKSVGAAVKTSGLMIAIRPTVEQLAKLRSGERTGVSIFGTGTREVVKGFPFKLKPGKKKPSRYGKMSTPTSETDGHAHTIDLCSPADCWSGALHTSYQTIAGSEQQHSHAWTYDPTTGAITILPDSGHTHTTDGAVSAETMAEALEDDEECEASEETKASDGGRVVVVQARAPGLSTPRAPTATVKSQEQAMATDQDKILELTKTVERLTALASLNDVQKAYHASLVGADAAAFLSKSTTERAALLEPLEVAKRAGAEVVYTSGTGEVFRKSDDHRLVTMAKSLDAANAATVQVTLEKRASTELSHFAKSLTVKAAIVKAIDGIADEAVRKEAQETIKGANAALAILGKAHGANDGGDPVNKTPLKAWDEGLATFAKAASIGNPLDAIPAFLGTPEGKTLKAAYDATRAYAQANPSQN